MVELQKRNAETVAGTDTGYGYGGGTTASSLLASTTLATFNLLCKCEQMARVAKDDSRRE